MNITREDLEHLYHELADAELQRMLATGNLTELAQSVAYRELRSRGVDAGVAARKNLNTTSEPENSITYVRVAHQLIEPEAQLIYGLLLAHDIPAELQGSGYAVFPGGVGNFMVLVPEQYAEQALTVISQDDEGGFELDDLPELSDLPEIELPEIELKAAAMTLPPAQLKQPRSHRAKPATRAMPASNSPFKTSESYWSLWLLLLVILLLGYACLHLACSDSPWLSLEILKTEC